MPANAIILKSNPGSRRVRAGLWRFVAREEALKRLQASEGMTEIIASLPRNPLPDAFIITPTEAQPEALESLAKIFSTWPKVAHVQLDSAWVKRFDALLRLGKLVVILLAVLFAGALVTITFNTIRLQILAQAAEIELAKLIGATDTYIQRPCTISACCKVRSAACARPCW
jgi:cell division transport system permease protein